MLELFNFNTHHFLENTLLAAALVALVYLVFRLKWIRPDRIFAKTPSRVAIITVTLAAALLPASWRLALLPWRPSPEPQIHDEYAHLLVADTLIAGRLANPPHALWRQLDTLYVLQHPAYAAIYPIGQGAILGAGKFFAGNPWFGIVFATAIMCGSIAWVLFELVPQKWAAIGVLPIAFTYGLQWVDSYWGGSFCAFGGAILFGAILRLRKSPSTGMAIVAALGWSIVWLIRPFEAILLFVLLWGSVTVWMVRARHAWKHWIGPAGALVLVQGCAGGLTLLHNRAVTGSFTKLPYTLSQQENGVPQSVAWQAPIPPPKFRFLEMKEMYFWQLHRKQRSILTQASSTAWHIWDFFAGPWFTLPLILALFAVRDRKVAIAWVLLSCAAVASFLYPFFFPHYIAAYSCVFAFLIVRGLMMLSRWTLRGRPIGPWLVLFIALGGLLDKPVNGALIEDIASGRYATRAVNSRKYIEDMLKSKGGAHVVFVRYGANHSVDNEWVYNAADVDASPIVWCRWLGSHDDSEVMRYYPDRQFWVVDVDGSRIATGMSHYQPQ